MPRTSSTRVMERLDSRRLEGTLPYMSPEQTGRTRLDGLANGSLLAGHRILKGILGMITSAEHVFYTALATAAAATSSASEGSLSLDQLRTLHGKLVNWAGHCPPNFAHKRRDCRARQGPGGTP
ncbi:hypothetical protein [Peristeroidobacter agariperforans]|uniref:hypothetical protein n=1 Tax=Peristeroidobacter agariperforans TaxID=268404 RepID=UPI00101C73F8|nr:hypothetical protein [Peristeroidobacter agariperforans]